MLRFRTLAVMAAVLSTACLDVSGSNIISLPFDFTNPAEPLGEGWISGVADVPADQVAEVNLVEGLTQLPAPFANLTGIRQGGTSIGSNLFLFHKKWIATPWAPGRQFSVRVEVTMMSNYLSGCTTGPGPAVFVKAGASGEEPMVSDVQGVLRFNLDKGTGASGGRYAQLGNITNGGTGCTAESPYGLRTLTAVSQPELLTIDSGGGVWLFMGTQSTFNGAHEVYWLGFRLILSAPN